METLNAPDLETLRYPVGRFKYPSEYTQEAIEEYIHSIETLPGQIRKAVEGLSEAQLDTPYRPEGWTVRQVVHHCADSHLNSFIRYKLALTEDVPTVKPYFEERWAQLPDTAMPVEASLQLLEGLHARWIFLLRSMSESDFRKTFYHPEHKREISLEQITALYAWHSRHHLAHITSLTERESWIGGK